MSQSERRAALKTSPAYQADPPPPHSEDREGDRVFSEEDSNGEDDGGESPNGESSLLEKLYRNSVTNACQNTCNALVACEQNLENNLKDLNCQQIMFMNFCHSTKVHPEATYYPAADIGPKPCEYCHSMVCEDDCERPTLYFLNKKPPFATNHDEWDENDHPTKFRDSKSDGNNCDESWVPSFF